MSNNISDIGSLGGLALNPTPLGGAGFALGLLGGGLFGGKDDGYTWKPMFRGTAGNYEYSGNAWPSSLGLINTPPVWKPIGDNVFSPFNAGGLNPRRSLEDISMAKQGGAGYRTDFTGKQLGGIPANPMTDSRNLAFNRVFANYKADQTGSPHPTIMPERYNGSQANGWGNAQPKQPVYQPGSPYFNPQLNPQSQQPYFTPNAPAPAPATAPYDRMKFITQGL